jgi:hypothetical protein
MDRPLMAVPTVPTSVPSAGRGTRNRKTVAHQRISSLVPTVPSRNSEKVEKGDREDGECVSNHMGTAFWDSSDTRGDILESSTRNKLRQAKNVSISNALAVPSTAGSLLGTDCPRQRTPEKEMASFPSADLLGIGKNPCSPTVPLTKVKRKEYPTQAELLQFFAYDPETGSVRNTVTRGSQAKAGKEAHSVCLTPQGKRYLVLHFKGSKFYAHVCIMIIMGVSIPEGYEVDHEDHDGTNNRWNNLRVVTRSQNLKNRSKQKNNTSGVTGVYPVKGKWRAIISSLGKRIDLGYYLDKCEAVAARKAAELRYGFHQNHGGLAVI